MSKKIIIDGAFKEETRVALIDNNTVEDFDRESLAIKQLKGNIYLAKITRIEPSLQAAFIDYGGTRHGFLPFSDIHPDYYNIDQDKIKDVSVLNFFEPDEEELKAEDIKSDGDLEENLDDSTDTSESNSPDDFLTKNSENEVGSIGSYSIEDETEGISRHQENNKDYKIQDVIKEGQYVLVQVLKEERGNKGVAMTTYISLAGKYCVFMANSSGKGGVSKKVDNLRDRKILKNILNNLKVPDKRSVIIRTAGVGKKPEDILRDYIYLSKLWNSIRQITLESKAPAFIHAEDDVIKRTIRDIYNETVDEVIVEGDNAFKMTKSLVKMIAPDSKTSIKQHTEKTPIFEKYGIEEQIMNLYNNKVLLPSGGSIVIAQTEALVTIDVNSGKATKERDIEEMAVATNIEAAKEIARQLKLRDLAGLVVIDFIDMFDLKNRRIVERTMRDAMANDRARVQMDRLSMFGLMEMSRQRLGASFSERISETCPCCNGNGLIRSREIVALSLLRSLRYAIQDKTMKVFNVSTSEAVAVYILNYKREEIKNLENDYNVFIFVQVDKGLEDNKFLIKKRKELSDEEREELFPTLQTGKVNLALDDDILYNISDEDEENYSFNKECYFEKKVKTKPSGKNNKYNYQDRKKQNKQRQKVKRANNNIIFKMLKWW